MREYFKNQSVNVAKKLIRLFFVDRNIEEFFKYLHPIEFSWVGPRPEDVITNFNEFEKMFRARSKSLLKCEVLNEEYQLTNSTLDSSIVIVKLNLDCNLAPTDHYQTAMNITFHFVVDNDQILCTHYHLHFPIKHSNLQNFIFFTFNDSKIFDESVSKLENGLEVDFLHQKDLLTNFMDSEKIAMKSFYYEPGMPYRYANRSLLKLLDCKRLGDFLVEKDSSSLQHIHPADQSDYIETLKNQFDSVQTTFNPDEKWQWQTSYFAVYRTQSCAAENKTVFEWGNLFLYNGRKIVNSFLIPIEEVSLINQIQKINDYTSLRGGGGTRIPLAGGIPSNDDSTKTTLLTDYGIHIGDSIIIFPKHRRLLLNDKEVKLTPLEFEILLMLVDHLNEVVPLETFSSMIWSDESFHETSNALKMHMSNLRSKLRLTSESQIQILAVQKKGYCLSVSD